MKYQVYNQNAEPISEITLADSVFKIEVKSELVQQVAVAQMANARQAIAHTKDRSEVRGGGRKPWRQKGTGRARFGSIRNPIWRGGGVTFGPTNNRNFSKNLNKKMKQKALLMVLSDKAVNQDLVIVDKLEITDYQTKKFAKIVEQLETKALQNKEEKRSLLIVDNTKNIKLERSAGNLSGVTVINLENINIVDLLNNRDLLLTTAAVKILETRYQQAKK